MAKILDDDAAPKRGSGRKVRYPWDEWLDGRPRLLEPGEDFHVSTQSMRTMIYVQAYKRGMRVATELHGEVGAESIKVQAYVPDAA